ncbi:hypothetical protein AMATHDRAFT_411 [Amanita thiersii Skay4041]|uniref:DUF7721 domain-containing protein n=1 Tax=Amanita thiersii Skay4041 TaxID=703135 RepID=A0A2A9NWC9_9AGAR|nr:hypothetical protein AMATHDRAFT_411 [Amanita thiersii Skay4041]
MNLAKQGFDAYSDSHSAHKTGGEEFNSPHHSGQSGSLNSGPDIDHDEAIRGAEKSGSGASDLFATALSYLNDNKFTGQKSHEEPLDEDSVTRAHDEAYKQDKGSKLSANSLGAAAAMQVLKQFTSGGSSHSGGKGNSQTQLISLAMAEATKLFDKSGGAASGNKQDAVNGAAMTVMKLLVQSKFSGTTGGHNSGGLGGLMSLASHFTK